MLPTHDLEAQEPESQRSVILDDVQLARLASRFPTGS